MNRITFALCFECEERLATEVIGREGWCAQCASDVQTCQACGSWVLADEAVTDDAGAFHSGCYGPNDDAACDAAREA
jgi:hypothetical protein